MTYACTLIGGLVCCGWLHSVTRGMWLVAPPISVKVCTAVIGCRCWLGCIWIVYTCQKSVEVLRLTGSLVLRILVCCLTVPSVSGIETDIMLFSQYGVILVHRYRVYGGHIATPLCSRNLHAQAVRLHTPGLC